MNRIQKYQDSIDRFFKNKSYLTHLNNSKECEAITDSIKKNNFLVTILLLTITNNINKKNKIHQHGYYIGSSMELLFLLSRNREKENIFNLEKNLLIKINSLANILLIQNLELSSVVLSKEKLLKNYNSSIKLLNTEIISVLDEKINYNENKKVSDEIINYNFKNSESVKKQLKRINQINKEELIKYIEKKYCSIIELAVVFTWNLAGGNENLVKFIQKIGYYFGFLTKIFFDILEIESDINMENDKKYTTNILINFGIQETFELFMNYKKKFIELTMKLDLFSNTIKELIDFLEDIFDGFIEKTTPYMSNE